VNDAARSGGRPAGAGPPLQRQYGPPSWPQSRLQPEPLDMTETLPLADIAGARPSRAGGGPGRRSSVMTPLEPRRYTRSPPPCTVRPLVLLQALAGELSELVDLAAAKLSRGRTARPGRRRAGPTHVSSRPPAAKTCRPRSKPWPLTTDWPPSRVSPPSIDRPWATCTYRHNGTGTGNGCPRTRRRSTWYTVRVKRVLDRPLNC